MKLWTSCFGRLKKVIARGLSPVSTARYAPDFFVGRLDMRLAPTKENFRLAGDEFDRAYAVQLSRLDPVKVAAELGDGACLLCWEGEASACHRSNLASWFALAGIEVEEIE